MHAGCGVLVEYLMCSHVLVQFGCCALVVALLRGTSVGRLRVTVLDSCVLRADWAGVYAEVLFVGGLDRDSSWLIRCYS